MDKKYSKVKSFLVRKFNENYIFVTVFNIYVKNCVLVPLLTIRYEFDNTLFTKSGRNFL